MSIALTPDLEEFIDSKIASGHYRSPVEVIAAALRLLDERDRLGEVRREELRREISRGIEQLENGRKAPLDMAGIKRKAARLPDTILRVAQADRLCKETNRIEIGGNRVTVMAGPCAVESRDQLLETAWIVKEAGAHMLRGGAFKPRTSPYSFQGLGEQGLQILAEARQETGLHIVTEVMSPEQVPLVSRYADVLQIGTRNMQNYALLNAVGQTNMPVLLKRGMMSTIEELLMSAEYIMSNGNHKVILLGRILNNLPFQSAELFPPIFLYDCLNRAPRLILY